MAVDSVYAWDAVLYTECDTHSYAADAVSMCTIAGYSPVKVCREDGVPDVWRASRMGWRVPPDGEVMWLCQLEHAVGTAPGGADGVTRGVVDRPGR